MWYNWAKEWGVYNIDYNQDPRFASLTKWEPIKKQETDEDLVKYNDSREYNKTQNQFNKNKYELNKLNKKINTTNTKNKTEISNYNLNDNKLYTAYKSILNYKHDLILINVIKIKDSSLVSLIKSLINNRDKYELYKYTLNNIYSVQYKYAYGIATNRNKMTENEFKETYRPFKMFRRGVMHVTCKEFEQYDDWKTDIKNNRNCKNCLACDWIYSGERIYLDDNLYKYPGKFCTAEVLGIVWKYDPNDTQQQLLFDKNEKIKNWITFKQNKKR